MTATEKQVERVVYLSCIALDAHDYDGYLSLFADELFYRVTTYSPDLRKDMVWLDHDRAEMKHLFKMLPQHVKLNGEFNRHAVVYRVEQKDEIWESVASVMLTYTDLEGSTRLMAVGRYHDMIVPGNSGFVIKGREVRLTTRDLSPGLHVPI